MFSYREFLKELRYALNHLYEPEILRLSPLQSVLLSGDRARTNGALGAFLISAVEVLKPSWTTPREAQAWYVYEFLYYRYVQAASQADLARQFSCSVREIRRQQSRALAVLAESLLQRTDIKVVTEQKESGKVDSEPTDSIDSSLKHEYEALLAAHQGHSTEVTTELLAIADVMQPLLRQYKVSLHLAESEHWFLTSVPDVVVRQALLSLLVTAVRWAAGGAITINFHRASDRIDVDVSIARQSSVPSEVDPAEGFYEASSLLALSGGALLWHQRGGQVFDLTVQVPAVSLLTVLAIDDNREILQLLTRYTNGTRYDLVACSEPAMAVRFAVEHNPAVITLDVMMAGLDGWQLIRELSQNRRTAHIPIVVCSVLAQEEVAESLGIRVYLRKPVSREAYLAALDFQVSETGTGSLPVHQ